MLSRAPRPHITNPNMSDVGLPIRVMGDAMVGVFDQVTSRLRLSGN